MKKKGILKWTWLYMLIVQITCILVLLDNRDSLGLHNTDAFSYHIQWSRVAHTLSPFSEPVLQDPGSDIKRVPFSMPHAIFGITSRMVGPINTYLLWCCIGIITTYFSTYLFARALGFRSEESYILAAVHYTFFHIISQLPPLSLNQLDYVIDSFLLKPGNVLHFGARQYPHDIFFYPLLYTVLSLTIIGIKKIRRGNTIDRRYIILWVILSLLLPFNYLYHWIEYAFVLMVVLIVGERAKWWSIFTFIHDYRFLSGGILLIIISWGFILGFQDLQLANPHGSDFALMSGLTKSKFILLPLGLLVRIVMWMVVLFLCLRIHPNSVVIGAMLIAFVFLMNMQLIIGKNIQPGHWSFGIEKVFTWVAIIAVAFCIKKYFLKTSEKFILYIIVFTLIMFTAQTWASWRYFEKMSRWDNERTELMKFLNSLPSSVALVPEIWLETDVLIHTHHYSFLPRAAQSALSKKEHLERIVQAAHIAGYSEKGFNQWIHIRSVRFFGMMYGTEKEFSSTLYWHQDTRDEVLKFAHGGSLPSWDSLLIANYLQNPLVQPKKLDFIVLHACEALPVTGKKVLFANSKYKVISVDLPVTKQWGANQPISEQRYPTANRQCTSNQQ